MSDSIKYTRRDFMKFGGAVGASAGALGLSSSRLVAMEQELGW